MTKRNQYIILASVMFLLIMYFVPLWQITLQKSMVDIFVLKYSISSLVTIILNNFSNNIFFLFLIIFLASIIMLGFLIIIKKSKILLKISLFFFIFQFLLILIFFSYKLQFFRPENSFYYTDIYQLPLLGCTLQNSVQICNTPLLGIYFFMIAFILQVFVYIQEKKMDI